MSSSPSFTVGQTKEGEEEELLAIEQGMSHTSSSRSRTNSRLEILMMEIARSTEQKLEGLARSQVKVAKSTEGKLENLVRSQSEQSKSTKEQLYELARSQSEQSKSTKEQFTEFARGQADLAYAQIGA